MLKQSSKSRARAEVHTESSWLETRQTEREWQNNQELELQLHFNKNHKGVLSAMRILRTALNPLPMWLPHCCFCCHSSCYHSSREYFPLVHPVHIQCGNFLICFLSFSFNFHSSCHYSLLKLSFVVGCRVCKSARWPHFVGSSRLHHHGARACSLRSAARRTVP